MINQNNTTIDVYYLWFEGQILSPYQCAYRQKKIYRTTLIDGRG